MKVFFHALLSGALMMSSLVWAGNNVPVVEIVTAASQRWHFRQIQLHDTGYGLVVSSRLITETAVSYLPGLLTRRIARKGGVHFSATLPDTIPSDATIKLAFHEKKPAMQTSPAHDATVAREGR